MRIGPVDSPIKGLATMTSLEQTITETDNVDWHLTISNWFRWIPTATHTTVCRWRKTSKISRRTAHRSGSNVRFSPVPLQSSINVLTRSPVLRVGKGFRGPATGQKSCVCCFIFLTNRRGLISRCFIHQNTPAFL